MKIEIGGGETPRKKGYKICDIRDLPNVDFCCNAIHLDRYIKRSTVTDVYARHFMEHLTFSEASMFLDVLKNILVPRGAVELIVPNMTFHINQWIHLKNDKRSFDHAKAGFWGWQRNATTENYWDIHKSGYDEETMKEFITKAGFTDFVSHNSALNAHLHVTFRK